MDILIMSGREIIAFLARFMTGLMEQCPAFLARRAAGSHSVYGA